MEENGILSEIENLLHAHYADRPSNASAAAGGVRPRRRFPLFLFSGLVAIVAIVPTGLRKSDMPSGRVTHQAADDRAKPS